MPNAARADDAIPPVGPTTRDSTIVPTSQLIHPAGETLEFAGRPVAIVLSPDGKTLFAKDNRGLVVVDAAAWSLRQELPFHKEGGSMNGIAISRDGKRVFATTAKNTLAVAECGDDGKWAWAKRIDLSGPDGKSPSFPCGVALSPDEKLAYVCLSRNNTLGIVDLESGELKRQVDVGIAPYAVLLAPDGKTAFVSNWGGRRTTDGDRTADSSGTPALVDERGVAASGTASIVDLESGKCKDVAVGLSPCGLELSADGKTLYVANANSDSVSFIDVATASVAATLVVKPDAALPFGSMPNGLALADGGKTLLVSLAGNNALAVVKLADGGAKAERIAGVIPTGWYPGPVAVDKDRVFVANIKGVGSRTKRAEQEGWNSHWHRGSLTRLTLPDAAELERYTAQVRRDARVPEALRALERGDSGAAPLPVPAKAGEPSVVEHVIYVIKENRTYDQVFGDLPQGNADPNLCIYGREITPNHHALAEEFALLDNYYCNSVLSADGHSWCTEGNVTPYLERSFGGFSRSYTFGNDPLTYSSSGFIWDHVLAVQGTTFRNYGEFDAAETEPKSKYAAVYEDFIQQRHEIARRQKIGVERMRHYTCPQSAGWNLDIPDVLRAAVFLEEFEKFERDGGLPNFVILYLPNDHTAGTSAGSPTPRSMVADNDLALGRVVDAVSHSRYWSTTCMFVIEDDPQNGFDHVDGHRSLCLVISPYTKRGAVVSEFYNQGSVVHTIERILGVPASNQASALSPVLTACFADKPDLKPYDCRPNIVPLAEMNPAPETLPSAAREQALASAALPLQEPDAADENTLNRILWHAARGTETPYPAQFAGAHGKGLAALGLKLASTGGVDADDDD